MFNVCCKLHLCKIFRHILAADTKFENFAHKENFKFILLYVDEDDDALNAFLCLHRHDFCPKKWKKIMSLNFKYMHLLI